MANEYFGRMWVEVETPRPDGSGSDLSTRLAWIRLHRYVAFYNMNDEHPYVEVMPPEFEPDRITQLVEGVDFHSGGERMVNGEIVQPIEIV
ncbi:hypothetical protein CLI64_11200 [Nostoc sp. CENA543]|uniref:hypothetical protein n=1 Tax=Nostoc sp. CENA543 TaxID=1869241 RepID=UPI000CA36DAA|nr:hypothetical protein [Nostoc sp. CENA543]AUT00921.1 hypothetical protein CLI64_11200 [Nostoc sp. CENA543]